MVGRLLWIPMCKSVGAFPDPRDNGSGDKKRILRIYISLNGSQPPFLFMKDRWSWTPPSNCGNTGNMPIQGHSTLYRKPQIKREDCPEKKEIMRGIEQRDLQKLILGPEHIYLTACSFLVPKSHPTLCNPHGLQPTRLPFPGIFQARILEWVVISFSWRSFQSRDWTCVSCIGRQILYHWATWEAMVKNMSYSGINLTKNGQKLHIENYKILLREFKEILAYSWIGTLNGVKVSVLFSKI